MLLYATQMPVAKGFSEEAFGQVVIDWVQSEQVARIYSHIVGEEYEKFDPMVWVPMADFTSWHNEVFNFSIQRVNQVVATRLSITIQVGKYMIDLVYNGDENYVTMNVHGEGKPVDKEHFLPVLASSFCRFLIDAGKGGIDNNLRMLGTPRYVDNPARHIHKVLDGDKQCKMPILMVTLSKSGEAPLDVDDLAMSTLGLAHVIVVPSDNGKINESLAQWGTNKERMKHVILFFPADAYGKKEPQLISIDKQGHHAIESCVTALQYYSRLRPMDSLQTWDGVTIAGLEYKMSQLTSETISVSDGEMHLEFVDEAKEVEAYPDVNESSTVTDIDTEETSESESTVSEEETMEEVADVIPTDTMSAALETANVEHRSGACGEMLAQLVKEGCKEGLFDVPQMLQITAGMTLMRLLHMHHKEVHDRVFETTPILKRGMIKGTRYTKVGSVEMMEKVNAVMERWGIIWAHQDAYDLVDGELIPLRAICGEDSVFPWNTVQSESLVSMEAPSVFDVAQALREGMPVSVYTSYARSVAKLVLLDEQMAKLEADCIREEEERQEQLRLEEERKAQIQRDREEAQRKAELEAQEKACELSPTEVKVLLAKLKELEEENESLREAYTSLEDKNEELLAENNELHKENKQLRIDYDRLLEDLEDHTDPDTPDTVQTPHGVAYTDEQGNLYMSKVGRLFEGDELDDDMQEGKFILLRGEEKDLYPHEVRDLVLDMLADYKKLCAPNSRREHVIQDLLEANHFKNSIRKRREELKNKIRTYRKMDSSFESYLRSIGFQVTGKGKHYKWTYFDDPRYVITAGKTISDGWCAGLNIYSVIERLML